MVSRNLTAAFIFGSAILISLVFVPGIDGTNRSDLKGSAEINHELKQPSYDSNLFVDDGGRICKTCNSGTSPLERTYDQWTTLALDLNDSHSNSFGVTSIDDNGNFIISGSQEYIYFANGTLSTTRLSYEPDFHSDTITHKYYLLRPGGSPPHVEIFSNAESLYNVTIDPSKFSNPNAVNTSISPDGRYVILAGRDLCNCAARVQIWEGSEISNSTSHHHDHKNMDEDHQLRY